MIDRSHALPLARQARELGISRDIVIERIAKGLSQTPGLVSDLEIQWLMTRLNELLDSE